METKNKKLIAVIAGILVLLVAVTCIAATQYLGNRKSTLEGSVILFAEGKETTLSLSDMKTSPVSVDMVNGKGESKHIEGMGIRLSEVTGETGFEQVSVISDDAYSATVAADEIENAILLIEEGSARLIVEKDKNAKRDVKNVVRIEVK